MTRTLLAHAVGTTILFGGFVAAHADEPRLLRPGQYHGNEITAVSGERWLGLVRGAGRQDRLVPVTLQVDTVRDELLDEDGPATGKLVSAAPGGDAIVLLMASIQGLRPGPVTTLTTDTGVAPGEPIRLVLQGDVYSVSLECRTPGSLKGTEQVACSLVVRHLREARVLRTYPEAYYVEGRFGAVGDDAHPTILWAGDLNGDAALDLLVDLTDHYNVSRPTLFLSRGRRALEPVATHESVGC